MVEAIPRLLTQWGLLTTVGVSIALTSWPAIAQITPDDTLGDERSLVFEDVVPGVDGISGGATRDANLFHSFQQFNVNEGRAAYFLNPDGIQNIFSRITGNDPSNILGRLGVLGEANLFLLNPNGIVFGENASLDVQGSFVATTANAMQFGDRGFFSATNPEIPTLLTVNPSAFWFNQLPAGSITNSARAFAGTQPSGLPEFGLRVPDGENLLFVGGDIFMDGGRLNALGGRVELTGLAAPGAIALDMKENAFRLEVPTDLTLADITLLNDARVSVRGTGGGDIVVNADHFRGIDGGRLAAGTEGAGNGGTIRVNADAIELVGIGQTGASSGMVNQTGDIQITTGLLSLQDGGLLLTSNALTQRPPGEIQIRATESITLDNSSILVDGAGNDGITIDTPVLTAQNDSEISIFSAELEGRNGDLTINAPVSITVLNDSRIWNTTGFDSEILDGRIRTSTSGNVAIATGQLTLADSSAISSTSIFTIGQSGNITIRAREVIARDDSSIDAAAFGGSGGSITVTADRFLAERGSGIRTNAVNLRRLGLSVIPGLVVDETVLAARDRFIEAATRSGNLDAIERGRSGNITLQITGAVELDGQAQDGSLSFLATGSDAGDAGNITLEAQTLRLQNGASIESTTSGAGRGGDLNLTADAIELTGFSPRPPSAAVDRLPSSIRTTSNPDATGRAGDVTLQTDRLLIRGGAAIDTTANGQGRGGDIRITARESVDIIGTADPQAPRLQHGLSSSSTSAGNAGDITILTNRLRLRAGGEISATTEDTGRGGDITIRANAIDVAGISHSASDTVARSRITTDTRGTGNAGTIRLIGDRLRIQTGAVVTANTSGSGSGGNIDIAADTIEVSGVSRDRTLLSAISSTSTNRDADGDAGTITLTTDRLLVQDGGQISAITVGQGRGGNLIITADSSIDIAGTARLVGGQVFRSGLRTDTAGAGDAGNIRLVADQVRLQDRGTISASTEGNGRGGTVQVTARDLFLTRGASLSARSRSTGQAGDIDLFVSDRIQLNNSRIITAARRSSGGAISIDAGDIQLRGDSDIQTNVDQGRETGGDIRLTADSILAFDDSDILAFARDGRGGNITLDTPAFFGEGYFPEVAAESSAVGEFDNNDRVDVNASGRLESGTIRLPDVSFIQNSLAEIPDNTIDADQLIANSCIARSPSGGTFVITGSGSLPERPGDGLESSYPTGNVQTIPEDNVTTETSPSSSVDEPIVEPHGVFQLPDGRLVISRFCNTQTTP